MKMTADNKINALFINPECAGELYDPEDLYAEESPVVKLGDTVMWRGWFGAAAPLRAKVIRMEVTETPRTKYGREVGEVSWDLVRANRVLFSLDNGSWAYGEQISPL